MNSLGIDYLYLTQTTTARIRAGPHPRGAIFSSGIGIRIWSSRFTMDLWIYKGRRVHGPGFHVYFCSSLLRHCRLLRVLATGKSEPCSRYRSVDRMSRSTSLTFSYLLHNMVGGSGFQENRSFKIWRPGGFGHPHCGNAAAVRQSTTLLAACIGMMLQLLLLYSFNWSQ